MAATSPSRKPFPKNPDPSQYQDLSEWDKMIQGYPYRPLHDDFLPQTSICRELVQRYNETFFSDEQARREILADLFHPSCRANKYISIEPSFRCDFGINIKMGDNFHASFDCVLLDSGLIQFGENCMLGPGVHVYSATHPLNGGYRRLTDMSNYFELTDPVRIGDNCWLGGGCIINPGVTLGNNVTVEPGAMATKSFPDNVVISGNPAKVIRHMPEPSIEDRPFWRNMDGIVIRSSQV